MSWLVKLRKRKDKPLPALVVAWIACVGCNHSGPPHISFSMQLLQRPQLQCDLAGMEDQNDAKWAEARGDKIACLHRRRLHCTLSLRFPRSSSSLLLQLQCSCVIVQLHGVLHGTCNCMHLYIITPCVCVYTSEVHVANDHCVFTHYRCSSFVVFDSCKCISLH